MSNLIVLNEENADEYDRLVVSLEAGLGTLQILIAVCDNSAMRQEIIRRYEQELAAQGVRCYHLQLNLDEPSLLQALIDGKIDLQQRAIATVLGAEKLSNLVAANRERLDNFLGYLQWTREALRGYPLPIVLWLPAAVSVEIAKRAPDFWSWRGGVFSFGFFAKLDLSKVVLSNNRDFESAPSDISQSSTSVLSVKQLEDSLAEALTTWGENSANIEPIYAQLGSAYAERVWTGKTENLNREIELAETYLNKAIALQKKFDRRYDLAYALSNLGYMYKFLGYWDRAEVLYKESVQIREKLGDQEGIAYIWGQLGYIENIRGNWDAAESLYRQSLQLRTELGDRAGMAESWGLLGDIERNRGNWDAGESLYRQSLQLRTELGDRAGMASSIGSLGEVELSRENLDSAETLLNDALQRCVDLGNLKVMAECNFRLAQVWQKREDLSIAQQYYNQAKTIYQQLGAIKDLERIEKEWEA